MRTKILVFVTILVLLMTSVITVGADGVVPVDVTESQQAAESGEMVDETPQMWFVEFNSLPTSEGTSLSTVTREQANFRSAAARSGIQYTERFAFTTLWNGLSVSVSPAELAKISRVAGVKAVYPVIALAVEPTAQEPNPDLVTALAMTGADIAQSQLGYTGAGVKVAVMDTGIDYDHPDLGGCFGPGCRVFTGYDFVGDAFNADPASALYNPVPSPDADPDDCNGHGSHVSGIIGANGTIKGVAPDVTFGAYRVFGCEGSTTADIMIAAMERALADGMQVLNMSIGSAYTWPGYPTAVASDRVAKAGMVVVASIGNNGTNGLYAAGAPGLGKNVIGVASIENTHVTLTNFTISPDDTKIGFAPATGAPTPPGSGSFPMTRTGTVTTTNDACNPIAADLTGQVVLIRRGTCSFFIKATNAMNAGAAAVVLYNNSAGRFSPTVAGTPAITIPVVAVSDTEGALINSRLAAGPVTMTWTLESFTSVNPTAGLISSFSSYGLSPDLALKPDIAAPGGLIYSTYPVEKGSYANISGTSMASPHVAGSVALLLQAKPGTPVSVVRDILQNSADPVNWWNNPGLGYLDNVHRQGAGLLDIDDAIQAQSYVKPGKIALGESTSGPSVQKITIKNNSSKAETYTFGSVNALSTGGTIAPSFSTSDASVTFSVASVVVPAGGATQVNATITPATGPVNGQYGGYITIATAVEGRTYRVPFAGFVGDYQTIPTLTNMGAGLPWLAKLSGTSYTNQPSGATYTLAGGDIPYILLHLEHQAQQLQMEVFDAMSGRSMLKIYDERFVSRNTSSTGFFAYTWDGTLLRGAAPDGRYVIRLSVLKALGDPANPAHWETWTSPVITIDRP